MKLRTRLNLVLTGLTAVFVAVWCRGRDPRYPLLDPRGDRGGQPRGRTGARQPGPDLRRRRGHRRRCRTCCSSSATCAPTTSRCASATGRAALPLPAADLQSRPRGAAVVHPPARPAPGSGSFHAPGRRAAGDRCAALARHSRCLGRSHPPARHRRGHAGRCCERLAFWLVGRALAPFPVIVQGLRAAAARRARLPAAAARRRGSARHRRGVQPHGAGGRGQRARRARGARGAHAGSRSGASWRCSSSRASRRSGALIAHELHDEFGQSVTAIRSLAHGDRHAVAREVRHGARRRG